jgi:hypothetical protein
MLEQLYSTAYWHLCQFAESAPGAQPMQKPTHPQRCFVPPTASFASGAAFSFPLLKVGNKNRKALNLQPYR